MRWRGAHLKREKHTFYPEDWNLLFHLLYQLLMIYDFWSLFYPDLAPSWATLTQPPETLESRENCAHPAQAQRPRHPRTLGDGVEGLDIRFPRQALPNSIVDPARGNDVITVSCELRRKSTFIQTL